MKNKDDVLYSVKYLRRLINRIDESINSQPSHRYSELTIRGSGVNNLDVKLERKILLQEYRIHLFNEYKVLRRILKYAEIDITTPTTLSLVDESVREKLGVYQEKLSQILFL